MCRMAALAGAMFGLVACGPIATGGGDVGVIPAVAPVAGPLAPRDECEFPKWLREFKDALQEAVAERDARALMPLVDPDVQLDYGGGSGRAELARRLATPEYRLWEEIEDALALGCGLSVSADGARYASWPWYFSKDLIPLDPFEAMIVTGGDVPLRQAPSADAAQIGTLSWDYVRLQAYSDAQFLPVTTRSGVEGFVDSSRLRSLVDYRVIANESGGKWTITAIIAGD